MSTANLPPRFDFTDPDLYASRLPVAELAELRRAAPIWWNSQDLDKGGFGDGGYWVVTKHRDVREVSRRSDVFSAAENSVLPRYRDGIPREQIELARLTLINMDEPQHSRLRKIISRGFTPRAIERLRSELSERAQQIAKTAAAAGVGDFVIQVASELPLQAIAGLLGVPQEDRQKLFNWSNQVVGEDDPEFAGRDVMTASAELMLYAMGLAAQRAVHPAGDIVTALIEADVDGHKLSADEFGFFVVLLAVAGTETTRNSITQGMMAFTDHPEQWQLFKAHRPATAADEIIRWATPITSFQRTALQDTELGGVQIKKGQRVVMMYRSANFDEEVFEDPFAFNILRDPNPHVGFGGTGAHFCIGANLARMTIDLMFGAIADHMPDLRPISEPERLRSAWTNGIKHWEVDYNTTGDKHPVRSSCVTEHAIGIGDVDLADPKTYAAGMPHDAFRTLRRHAPVAWHPYKDGPGFLALTAYDDILAVSRDSATWSSQQTGTFFDVPSPEDSYQLSLIMLTMDPPRHTALRGLVSRGFTPRHVSRLNARMAAMARQIVDDVVERGECDFVTDVAGALPSFVIAELLGIPLEDGRRLYELTDIMNAGLIGDPAADQARMQMFEYATELAARKRAVPADDIATSLLQAEVDGQRLTDLEFNLFFLLLINAGGDTTRNLIAAGTLALMEHPAEQARLIADPSLLSTAIEEMLRYVSPVIVFVRTATKDTQLRGMPIKQGERVAMFYPSANRDEKHFAQPDRFDIGRDPNPHLAFGGGGTHFCLGASLARAEAAAIFPEVLTRMKHLELDGPIVRTPSTLINGLRSMPVRFTAASSACR